MFESSYSATGFWDKLVLLPQRTGCAGIKTALTLYVVLTECDTPIWVKTTIVASLFFTRWIHRRYSSHVWSTGKADDLREC